MQLFVGLGNPNPNNSNNRHNVGFLVIDAINAKFKFSKQKPKFKGTINTGAYERVSDNASKYFNSKSR